MVKWFWSVDDFFWPLSINYNMDIQYQRCTYAYGNGAHATFLFFKVRGQAYGRRDVPTYVRTVKWQPNVWDRWVTKLSKVWGSARPPRAR